MYFLMTLFLLAGAVSGVQAEGLPEWLVPLREAVYEQRLQTRDVNPLYQAAKTAAAEHCSGTALDLALSRCEYLMGRCFQYYGDKKTAGIHYDEGMRLAEKALDASPSDEAWVLRAENLSQNCAVRSTLYAMSNGLNVEKYAKNALAINSRNAAAQYLIASRWVYAPAPLNDTKKGIAMMTAILENGDMEKDDTFNVYSAIGYAYIVQDKKYDEGRPWVLKALEVYPTNQFAADMLTQQ